MKVGVVFGGRSVEHQVSVITGMQIMENMDKERYTPVPIFIDKDGKWFTGECLKDFATFKNDDFSEAIQVMVNPTPGDYNLYAIPEQVKMFGKKVVDKVDMIFPALHGTYGEDGRIQGVFECMDIPYVGCNVLAAAVGMDKITMKDVFKSNDIPIVNYVWFYRKSWDHHKEEVLNDIEERLPYPMFVKPANLGSSIGITKAIDRTSLKQAIEVAVRYDRKIIVEQAVVNPREINCAALGIDDRVEASLCEEPLGWKDVLTFADKYMSKDGSKLETEEGVKGKTNTNRAIPADLTEELQERIEVLAKQAFMAIDATGTARVDFLIDEEENVYVNEINTLPGSLGFYLWEGKGVSFKELITRTLEFAEERHHEKGSNLYTFDVDLYHNTSYGSKL